MAVRGHAVLVVDNVRVRAVNQEAAVGRMLVLAVARGRHADNLIALGEDDNVFPVVAMAAQKGSVNGLVLFVIDLNIMLETARWQQQEMKK